jgi:hypothetical protein
MRPEVPMTPPLPSDPNPESPAERYAAGRMGEAEEREFEIRMLEDPELAAEVETVHRMRGGFRQLAARGELEEKGKAVDRPHFRTPLFALAAGLVALLIGATLVLHSRHSRELPSVVASSLTELGHPRAGTPHIATYILAHTRGSAAPTSIEVSDPYEIIALRILPSLPSDSGVYRVTLERLGGVSATTISQDIDAQTGTDGFVRLYLDPSYLTAGEYRLSLIQPPRSDRFSFSVSRSSPKHTINRLKGQGSYFITSRPEDV